MYTSVHYLIKTIKKLTLNFFQLPKVNTLHTTYYPTHITNIKLEMCQPTYHFQDEVAILLAKTLNIGANTSPFQIWLECLLLKLVCLGYRLESSVKANNLEGEVRNKKKLFKISTKLGMHP